MATICSIEENDLRINHNEDAMRAEVRAAVRELADMVEQHFAEGKQCHTLLQKLKRQAARKIESLISQDEVYNPRVSNLSLYDTNLLAIIEQIVEDLINSGFLAKTTNVTDFAVVMLSEPLPPDIDAFPMNNRGVRPHAFRWVKRHSKTKKHDFQSLKDFLVLMDKDYEKYVKFFVLGDERKEGIKAESDAEFKYANIKQCREKERGQHWATLEVITRSYREQKERVKQKML